MSLSSAYWFTLRFILVLKTKNLLIFNINQHLKLIVNFCGELLSNLSFGGLQYLSLELQPEMPVSLNLSGCYIILTVFMLKINPLSIKIYGH